MVRNTIACDWEFTDCVIDPENLEWVVQWEVGAISAATQNNGHMSIANLMDNYWRSGRVLLDGTMNGNVEVFDSVMPSRLQNSITIPKCCEEIHWNTYIITDLGDGKIYSLVEKTDSYEVELLYP